MAMSSTCPIGHSDWRQTHAATGTARPSQATTTTIALILSRRLVSSTRRTIGASSGRLPIARPARFSKDSAKSMRTLAMNLRGLVFTVSEFPSVGKARATAFRAQLLAVAAPSLKAARTVACGLERFGKALPVWLVQWCNVSGWLTVGSSLRLLFSPQEWSVFVRESTLFSYPS